MEKKRIAVSGEEIIAPKKNIHCDFGICVRKGYVLLLMWMSIHGRLDFTIMRKIYCIVRLVVWKNQLMNSMKNFWNLVVFLEPEIK